jgi:hypothetical protein
MLPLDRQLLVGPGDFHGARGQICLVFADHSDPQGEAATQGLGDRLVHLLPLRVPRASQGLKGWKERDHHRE